MRPEKFTITYWHIQCS